MDDEISITIEEMPTINVEISQVETIDTSKDDIDLPDLLLIYNIAKV